MSNRRAPIPLTAPIDETDDAPLQSFWWLKRMVMVSVLFIVFACGSWLWLDHRAERRLAAEIQEWKREGLPIEPKDFEQPPVPDEENAAVALSSAAKLVVFSEEWHRAENDEEFDKHPWSTHAREVADRTLVKNRAASAALRAARELTITRWALVRGEDVFSNNQKKAGQIDLSAMWSLGQMTMFAAQSAQERGDDEAFLEYLKDVRFVALGTASDPGAASYLTGTGIDYRGIRLASAEAHHLRLGTPPARTMARELIKDWLSENDLNTKAWVHTANEATLYLDLQRSVEPPKVLHWNDGDPKSERPTRAIWRLLRPLRIACLTPTLIYARHETQASRLSNWPAVSTAISTLPPPQTLKNNVEPINTAIQSVNQVGFIGERFFRISLNRRVNATVAAIQFACRLYSIDHNGKNPANLNELVPDYLPAVPLNLLDPKGGTFRIHTATTQPFIYGVGIGTDLVANGTWMPMLAQHEDFSSGIFVSFLNPYPNTATTLPSTLPMP